MRIRLIMLLHLLSVFLYWRWLTTFINSSQFIDEQRQQKRQYDT